jgi:hypothetical protein
MEFFLFAYNILTAYLFGYAVFFIVSLLFKNQNVKIFVDFSESKIPAIGLLLFFVFIIALSIEFCERTSFLGGLKQYSFSGDKLINDFFVYQLLNIAFLVIPTQLFRFKKVNKSTIFKLFFILFFIFNLDWILEEIEIYLNLSGPKVYCSYYSLNFYFRIFKMLIVYIGLNFILIKFFNRNAKQKF